MLKLWRGKVKRGSGPVAWKSKVVSVLVLGRFGRVVADGQAGIHGPGQEQVPVSSLERCGLMGGRMGRIRWNLVTSMVLVACSEWRGLTKRV